MADINMPTDVPLDVLASEIKARIESGDRAADKAADHFRAAGLRLLDAKKQVAAAGIKFDTWLAESAISRSRAYELMSIARGTKTLAGIRAATAERVARHAKQSRAAASVTNGLSEYKRFSEMMLVALNAWAAAPKEWKEAFADSRNIPEDVEATLAEILTMQWATDGMGFEAAQDASGPSVMEAA